MVSYRRETNFLYLNNLMRMLWEQHAVWTRMIIISIVENLPDEEPVTKRLLRNPVDIAAAFKPFYGKEIAYRVKNLITDHLVIAAQLVKAAKAGDNAAVTDIKKRWYANADEIAIFFNYINPYWPRETMIRMWHEHLVLVESQALARLNKDYTSDISFYDEGEKLLLEMADEFVKGITKQFPRFFG